MDVVTEHDMTNIKSKMTDIRRARNDKIFHNYYNNCENSTEIFAIYSSDSVVFWDQDKDVTRGYFYSNNKKDLIELLQALPAGCIIDYLTRTKDELVEFLSDAKLVLLHEMHRMSAAKITEEEKREIARRKEILRETLYMPLNVRCAEESDLDLIYENLYKIFDRREAHLPSKEELHSFIRNKWVSLYVEDGVLMGINIFQIISGARYGYLLWNGAGPEGYFSMKIHNDHLYEQYFIENGLERSKQKPNYCWVNAKNKKARRLIEYWGQKFDGLYDFVFEKVAL